MRPLILIVEDNAPARTLASMALRRLGYDVVEAEDGVGALEALEADAASIRLVFSDVRMPRMTGTELADIVAERWPQMPFLLTSGHLRSEDYGCMHAILPKPYTRQQLSMAVGQALGSAPGHVEVPPQY